MDEAARVHPKSWWWIKADGCDIVDGLGESVRGEWSGDVNLDQKALKQLRLDYEERLKFIREIGLGDHESIIKGLNGIKKGVFNDIEFVTSGMHLLELLANYIFMLLCFDIM